MGYHIDFKGFNFSTEDIKIKYMRECICMSYKYLPTVFWGRDDFKKAEFDQDSVCIPIEEWLPFWTDLLKLMKGDGKLTHAFIRKMKDRLKDYDSAVENLRKDFKSTHAVKPDLLQRCFMLYSFSQCYAFFNLIPMELFRDSLQDDVSVDKCMISLIGSHRNIRQIKETQLAAAYKNGELSPEKLNEYTDNEYLLNFEYEWNFYRKNQYDKELVMRNITMLSDRYSKDELTDRINRYRRKHESVVADTYKMLDDLSRTGNEGKWQALFMVNIATQEEIRHIINVRFMNIVGEIAAEYGIDIARTGVDEFVRMTSY